MILLKFNRCSPFPLWVVNFFFGGPSCRMLFWCKSKSCRPRPTSRPRNKSVNGIPRRAWKHNSIGPSSFVKSATDLIGVSCMLIEIYKQNGKFRFYRAQCWSSFRTLTNSMAPKNLRAYIKSAVAYCKKPGNERLVKPLGFQLPIASSIPSPDFIDFVWSIKQKPKIDFPSFSLHSWWM